MSVALDEYDWEDGGAFPEIHLSQFPNGIGDPDRKKAKTLVATTGLKTCAGADGQPDYSSLIKGGMSDMKIVHSGYDNLVEKLPTELELERPTEEEEDAHAADTMKALQSSARGDAKPATGIVGPPLAYQEEFSRVVFKPTRAYYEGFMEMDLKYGQLKRDEPRGYHPDCRIPPIDCPSAKYPALGTSTLQTRDLVRSDIDRVPPDLSNVTLNMASQPNLSQNKALISAKTGTGPVADDNEAEYIRYTPADTAGGKQAGQQRIIKMVNVQRDPLDPPHHQQKRVPGGAPSPPAPVQ
eukprot:gene23049-1401_t